MIALLGENQHNIRESSDQYALKISRIRGHHSRCRYNNSTSHLVDEQFREPQSRLDPLAAAIYSSHSPRIRCVIPQMPLLQVLPPTTGDPVQVSEE